jgi:hypothetical protein
MGCGTFVRGVCRKWLGDPGARRNFLQDRDRGTVDRARNGACVSFQLDRGREPIDDLTAGVAATLRKKASTSEGPDVFAGFRVAISSGDEMLLVGSFETTSISV